MSTSSNQKQPLVSNKSEAIRIPSSQDDYRPAYADKGDTVPPTHAYLFPYCFQCGDCIAIVSKYVNSSNISEYMSPEDLLTMDCISICTTCAFCERENRANKESNISTEEIISSMKFSEKLIANSEKYKYMEAIAGGKVDILTTGNGGIKYIHRSVIFNGISDDAYITGINTDESVTYYRKGIGSHIISARFY